MQRDLIRSAHTGITGGPRKTLDQIQRRFYWCGWRADVHRYYRQCAPCAQYHRGNLPRQQNRQFAGMTTYTTMPVLIEEPTDGDSTFDWERSVATSTPLDDRSGTETGLTADADAVPHDTYDANRDDFVNDTWPLVVSFFMLVIS